MKKRFSTGTVLALMLLVATATILVTQHFVRQEFNQMLENSTLEIEGASKFLEAKGMIEQQFIGTVDPDALVDGAIAGMVEATGDRWSYYVNAEDFAQQQEAREAIVGIGVTVMRYQQTEWIRITQVYDDSPAKEAGIEPMDILIEVDGQSVEELGYEEAIERVRGDEFTLVDLKLLKPDGTEYGVTVQRRKVAVVNVSSEMLPGNIGYVRIAAFQSRVNEEFAMAVDNLTAAGAQGMIFDVRFNPGGELSALVKMLDKLLSKDDIIIITRTKEGEEMVYRAGEGGLDMPMVVIVNEDSYSAAEFFAACLQEYGLAEIVGEKTVGKGYAQHALRLKDDSYIYLSAESYYTPEGVSLAGIGITPDHPTALEDVVDFYSPDHGGDAQFEKAMEVIGGLVAARRAGEDAPETTP